MTEFQVIPPCGGIPLTSPRIARRRKVSSHTPLRGYSADNMGLVTTDYVSSHTPLRGYSDLLDPVAMRMGVSSHTPLRGYSQRHKKQISNWEVVSSHTPLRGYSLQAFLLYLRCYRFQVIPPCGGIRRLRHQKW